MKKKLLITVCSIIFLTVAIQVTAGEEMKNETLTQVSTIDALLNGVYDGETNLKQLVSQGDLGIGTFQALNGEMIVLEGKVYQVTSDGAVRLPDAEMTTPFAAVTFFESDMTHSFPAGTDFKAFKEQLDQLIPTPNIFYAIKLKGTFRKVKTRSVPKQHKPYPPLQEVAKKQPVFEFENVEGTMIGFRCPPYVKGINVPGYHLHFLTKDKKGGGHVLEFNLENAQASLDYTSQFTLILPEEENFYATNLKEDKSKELETVER